MRNSPEAAAKSLFDGWTGDFVSLLIYCKIVLIVEVFLFEIFLLMQKPKIGGASTATEIAVLWEHLWSYSTVAWHGAVL